MFGKVLRSDDDTNTISSKMDFTICLLHLLHLSFTFAKMFTLFFLLAIYQLMKDLMQVFRYHYSTLRGTMYLLFVNISARVYLSRLNISSRKSEIALQFSVILQTNSLSNCSYFLVPGCIFCFLDFWYFTIYLLYTTILLRKALSVKQHIKTSVGTRKFLSEFYLEVASIDFNMKLLSFVSFKRFSGVKIYTICDALLPLTQNLLLNPLSYCILLFRLFIIQLFIITSNAILINFFFLRWLF